MILMMTWWWLLSLWWWWWHDDIIMMMMRRRRRRRRMRRTIPMSFVMIDIWLLIKIPLSRNGHSSRIKNLLSRNFRELHVYLSRGPCWPTTPLMKIRSPPAKLRQRITDHFLVIGSLLNMQLASRNPFSGHIFFCKVYWPTPFNMHFDFRPLFRITFAELSRKYPYSQTPAISRGCTEGKAKTRGLGVWLSQSLTFGNLATATRILWCPSPAGPRAAVGGSPLHIIMIIPNFRETFAK